MSNSNKHRYWWFILYPDSSPADWKDILKFRGLPIAISPLHEFDLKNEEGELKKPHYHIILCYSGPTTYNAVKALTVDELNSTIPKALDSVRGAYDYLTHKHDPDKFQYSEDEIELMNGFDLFEMVQMSEKDKSALDMRVLDIIDDNNITEYWQLLKYLRKVEDFELYNYVRTHTIHLNTYITSRRHSSIQSDDDIINNFNKGGEK